MRVGKEAATSVQGVRNISAGNYEGKLGKILIPPKDDLAL
jgi:formylmethanofuran:tetrahydromethanopterin formyltransferase